MSPLWLLFLALFPAPSQAARERAWLASALAALGAEIETTWFLDEAALLAFDARLCAFEDMLARWCRGGYGLVRDRGEIVDIDALRRRIGAAFAVLVAAAAIRPERLRFRRGSMSGIRRAWAVTNRRRTPAYRRRRLRRPDAAALEFSG